MTEKTLSINVSRHSAEALYPMKYIWHITFFGDQLTAYFERELRNSLTDLLYCFHYSKGQQYFRLRMKAQKTVEGWCIRTRFMIQQGFTNSQRTRTSRFLRKEWESQLNKK